MSRISGIIHKSSAPDITGLVKAMTAASSSASDWFSRCEGTENAVLGWCGWRAPRISRIEHAIVVLDGCVYNRRELADEKAASDAATIARLYLKNGFEQTIKRINGDFALAVYDSNRRSCFLGRDRFGLKPAYYIADAERFAFASRIRALLGVPGVSSDVDRSFVARFAGSHYRTFDNNPHASPYLDVRQVPAGHFVCWSDGQLSISKYWSLEDKPDLNASERELADEYRELLLDSVNLRICEAEQPAFTLSGGMDSSSVLGCAVRSTGAKQHAFSAVYEDKTYDESLEIRTMCDTAVAEWHRVHIGNPDIAAMVAQMVELHDEPVATATWLAHYQLCGEVRAANFRSLFGGLGGDELNAGEYEYFYYFFADLQVEGRTGDLSRETKKWIEYHDHPVFRKSFEAMRDGLSRLVDIDVPGKCLPDTRRLHRYRSAIDAGYFDLSRFEPAMDHVFPSYLKNRMYQDIFRETAPCCLRAEDRQCTAAGIDNYLPFFDYRLVEFMFRISGSLKIRDGVTKYLLRESMRGILPEETRSRVKKTGWNAPAHVWFSGSGQQLLLDLIASRRFRERGIYNLNEVRRLVDEHSKIVASGRAEDNHMMFFWQLLNLETWFQWLERERTRSPRPVFA